MTEIIKQRLVGMLIVVIAGVVFLPDLLDGQKQLTKEEFKKVPAKPAIDEQPILTEFPTEQIDTAMENVPRDFTLASDEDDNQSLEAQNNQVTEGQTVQVETLKESETPPVPPVVKPEPEPSFKQPAWILQLGSFKHKENVTALRNKLLDAGFKTFIKPVQTKSGVLSKVYLGPDLDKQNLVKAQAKLKELVGLEGKITTYDPIK